MRESEFRRFLADRLGARSVDSYVAYCNRIRRDVGADLDSCDLSDIGLSNLAQQLERAGAPPGTVQNCLSALRAYGQFRHRANDGSAAPSSPRTMHVTAEQREAWATSTAPGRFNRWLDAQVRDRAGAFDLERLHALAAQYGISKREEYAHLNAGQQRMNLGNMLRRMVPPAEYTALGSEPPQTTASSPTAPPADDIVAREPVEPEREVPKFIREATVLDLLLFYGQVMDELRGRQVVRTSNSPVGDYAELLFSRAFDWALEGNSAAGHDATDANGVRYQIKARRRTPRNGSRQLSAIRRLNDKTFDHLAAVLFNRDFKVVRAILIPHSVVVGRARRREHTNSWLFMLEDRVWQLPEVRDVTAELVAAQATI